MRLKLFCLAVFAAFAASMSAQNGQLSLGLSSAYYPGGVVGLGGTLDYRWRLGGHVEAIGQLTVLHMWRMESQRDEFHSNDDGPMNLYFGGLGLGYRHHPGGFHIGLLGGGMHYVEDVGNGQTEPRFMTGLALTLGTGIGQRMDLSLDSWVLQTMDVKKSIGVLPMLRFSYALCGRK